MQKEARKSLEGVEAVSTDLTSVFEGFKVSRDAPERKRERAIRFSRPRASSFGADPEANSFSVHT